jgi:hypothetical protein
MTGTMQAFGRLLVQMIREPATVAGMITGAGLPRNVLWSALALVTILSVLLVALIGLALPADPMNAPAGPPITPLTYAVILGGSLVITIFALHFTGLMLGGKGAFEDTLALVVWLQVLLLVLQAAQAVLLVALPLMGSIAALASVAIALWVLVNFINVAQRFDSLGRAALTLVAALLGVGVGLSVLLGIIGASV